MDHEEFKAKYVNKIHCADCLELMKDWPDGCVDLVLTDPPYGINHSSSYGASWQNTTIAGDSDTSVRDEVLDRWPRVAAFGTWKTQPISKVRGVLIWDKGPAFGMGDLSFPWKPSWELIYVRGDRWEGKRDEGVLRGHIQVSWESKGRCHPHQKPVTLMMALLKKMPTASLILDPFCGSGTTCVAAKLLGRDYIGIDISEEYCKIARERLKAVDTGVPVKEARAGQLGLFE